MSRKLPTKEETLAGLLLQHLGLIASVPIQSILRDKPDIQIGNEIGIEVVQVISEQDKQIEAYADKCLFGKHYTGEQARKIVEENSRKKYIFLESNGGHYISPNLPFVTSTGGGGFNLLPRLEKLSAILKSKAKKWCDYKYFKDRRCFAYCYDLFFGVDSLNDLQKIFSKVYLPEAYDVLYLFGVFTHLVEVKPEYCAVIELRIIRSNETTEIVPRVFAVNKKTLYELQENLYTIISKE